MQYWLTRFQIIFFEKSRKILVSSEMGMFLAAFELSNGRKKAYSLAWHGMAWHWFESIFIHYGKNIHDCLILNENTMSTIFNTKTSA